MKLKKKTKDPPNKSFSLKTSNNQSRHSVLTNI